LETPYACQELEALWERAKRQQEMKFGEAERSSATVSEQLWLSALELKKKSARMVTGR